MLVAFLRKNQPVRGKGDTPMKSTIKYIGMDVHQSTISVAVLDAEGKLVMQSILATHAAAILDFLHGLRGTLHVTFEEGTQSAWLYDLLVQLRAAPADRKAKRTAFLLRRLHAGFHASRGGSREWQRHGWPRSTA